ncbi:sensor histidine kinase [Paenibacillus sp.]|uniref:cache domain-containing sensor histidine kinase n=1 Tax=Paenibacillus sp. TaxID=58172 RepID=UPI002D4FA84B|nr:sensor histidine kinase [Paenibacillus sp.]HZG85419.1 sensor histidine kinase [Paenibacillus sp.]
MQRRGLRGLHFRLNIRAKLAIAFLSFGLLTIFILGFISYTYYSNGVQRDFYRISQEATLRLNHHIEFYLYQLSKSTSSVVTTDVVQRWMKGDGISGEERKDAENALRRYVAINFPEIVGMFLITPDGRTLAMSNLSLTSETLVRNEPWYNSGFREEVAVIPTHRVQYVPGDVRVLSLEIPVYSVENIDYLGKLVIDFLPEEIESTFSKAKLAPSGQFFIVSDQDTIVYALNYRWLGLPRGETEFSALDLSDNEAASIQFWNGKRTLVASSASETTGWTFVSVVPFDEMASATRNTPNAMLLTFLIIAVCILLVVPFLSGAFVKPIMHLRQVMRSVERGDLQVRAAYHSGHDEFQYLNRSFNAMIDRVNELLETVSELKVKEVTLQLKEKEAMVKALQNQINPHFLYNSLDIIKSMAYLADMPDIVKMSRALADFYRYTVQDTHGIVKLEDELKHLGYYLTMIHLRFPSFQSKFSVNDKFLPYRLPKLVLQPIVENAVKYGIEPKGGKGSIIVNAYDEHGMLIIEVADNGPGIPEARLEQIHRELDALTKDAHSGYVRQQSLGIANVHARIVLQYGEPYGLSITSFEDRGTVVSIRLPLSDSEDYIGKGVAE